MNIILFGFKGAGKTTIGKHMAQKLGMAFVDTDSLLAIAPYSSLRELYHAIGEQEFRRRESSVLRTLDSLRRTVISLGGGAVLDPSNVTYLQSLGKLIYITVRLDTLKTRNVVFSEQTYHQRLPVYESIPAERIQSETYGFE